VVRTIVAILAAHVRKAETERTRANPPKSLQAYDCYLQVAESQTVFSSSYTSEDLYETGQLRSSKADIAVASPRRACLHPHKKHHCQPAAICKGLDACVQSYLAKDFV